MTTEYDELLARLDARAAYGYAGSKQAAAAIRELIAQVVECDAVLEQVRKWNGSSLLPLAEDCDFLDTILDQAPRDALAAHDKTVRATALRDAAQSVRPVVIRWEDHGGNIELMLKEWLHARADQEEQ